MSKHTFEIGLVGAGAISAGAYTGGVMDFIVQALDQWYAAKRNDERVPPHDVKISVFSGASAGAMTAAIAAAYLGSDQPPVTSESAGLVNNGKNKLFDSWVDRIDISALLESRDLENENDQVVSLLDSTILAEIADSGLSVTPRAERRPYLAENFELLLTVTNLRGVPYAFQVTGNQTANYDMSLHADYMHFRINEFGQDILPDRYAMTWADFNNSGSEELKKLKLAALASGAFPVGLAPRLLTHTITGISNPDLYSSRTWPIPDPHSHNPHHCVALKPIPANWGDNANFEYSFQCVDGGVMNNEPLELARQILTDGTGHNYRDGERADKAILLIDPFPSNTSFDLNYTAKPDLLKTIKDLFGALKNQARFKPDELKLAADEDVYSRFMIAPSRENSEYPIACGSLGGFGGFLKRDFRAHDYFLGRRNAQKFLKDHFVLPENNPLFSDWTEDMKDEHCAKDKSGNPKIKNRLRLLPIIPVTGVANVPCDAAKWPQYSDQDLNRLEEQLDKRVEIVMDRLVNQYFKSNNPFIRVIAKFVLGQKKKELVQLALGAICKDLKEMQLME